MKDISLEISQHIEDNSLKKIIKKYHADPTLTYSISDKKISIKKEAFSNSRRSLELIAQKCMDNAKGDCLSIEMAATALIDEKNLVIYDVIIGELGNDSFCDWEAGNLLPESYNLAEIKALKVSLGHTHPVFRYPGFNKEYAAMPSLVKYSSKKEIQKWVQEPKVKNALIASKLYKKYGGDYCEIYIRGQVEPLISSISWIMSPALNQLGIFKVKEHGVIMYYPWIVV